ncbi:response regulator transcription factor [Chitinophaga vietnamensis]|uniref:response regulator transcription factor n=1 Tax=Chitinophaga vietnamensis TaxID=2593957 RepID=UPI001177C4B6|nr:response regulator transcription factor [Chitinophaga vietnamensis]
MKILVVEDEKRIADLIRKGLTEEGYNVLQAFDGESAYELALSSKPDMAVLDIMLPAMDGIALCKTLKQLDPELPVLILTALGETGTKLEGFEAGASDYLVKPFDFRELLARLRILARRKSAANIYKGGFVLQIEDLELNLYTKAVTRAGQAISLTRKEFSLLEFMMRNPNRVLTRTEIADRVWNTTDWKTNFIDVYVNNLRRKIDRDFKPRLIYTRTGMGFMLQTGI